LVSPVTTALVADAPADAVAPVFDVTV